MLVGMARRCLCRRTVCRKSLSPSDCVLEERIRRVAGWGFTSFIAVVDLKVGRTSLESGDPIGISDCRGLVDQCAVGGHGELFAGLVGGRIGCSAKVSASSFIWSY